jgi:hypothetical protein
MNVNSHAPLYTKKERIRFVLINLAWGAPVFIIAKFWFFPWLSTFANVAHCYRFGAITGTQILLYSVFVGLPSLIAIGLLIISGPKNWRILSTGQTPLPDEKVFTPTKYRYGFRARMKPLAFVAILIFLLGLSVRGIFWAQDALENSETKPLPEPLPECVSHS